MPRKFGRIVTTILNLHGKIHNEQLLSVNLAITFTAGEFNSGNRRKKEK